MIFVFLFLMGLVVGSFINAQVYRLAVKYKIIKSKIQNQKRSCCDFCGRQLKWWENVPVFGWLFLKGRSKCCGKKLSILYPIVELITGILFLQISNFQNPTLLLVESLIISFLVFSAVFDLRYMILPDFSTASLVVLVIVLHFCEYGTGWDLWRFHLVSAVVLFLFFWGLYLITKGKGMGFGDVKLAFFIGLFLGWPGTLIAFYVAFLVGAIVAVFLMALAGFGRKSLLPFGPFLILATLVSRFCGDWCWDFCLSVLY